MSKKEFDFVEYWANYCYNHPEEARKKNIRFVNSIFERHNIWRKEVLSKPNGPKLLAKLYNVKNPEIIKSWKKESKELQNSCR